MLFSKKIMKVVSAFVGSFFVVICLSLFFYYNFLLVTPVGTPLTFSINKGTSKIASVETISENLTSLQSVVLKAYLFFHKDTVIEAGSYNFSDKTRLIDVITNLKNGTKQDNITFLPGWNVEQNAFLIAGNSELKNFAIEYYQAAKKYQGYLYPDTYNVDINTKPEELVTKQKEEFETKTQGVFSSIPHNLSKEEVVIIASIVQREALGDKDNRQIADILTRRYVEGMALDADATTQYAVLLDKFSDFSTNCIQGEGCSGEGFEFWKKSLTESDLKLDNPFNTRGKLGLPPYPICNPSVSSINAVLNSEKNPYYYYLHDSKGNTYFAKTLDEHVANINKYL